MVVAARDRVVAVIVESPVTFHLFLRPRYNVGTFALQGLNYIRIQCPRMPKRAEKSVYINTVYVLTPTLSFSLGSEDSVRLSVSPQLAPG